MKKNFRLQKILEYRERIVELEKNKLTELHLKLNSVKEKIKDTSDNIARQYEEQERAENIYKSMYDKYIKKLKNEMETLNRVRKQLELNIEIQKKKVMDAMERHKIMQKLKDRHVENYRAFLNKEEMKLIDELAVTRSGNHEN
jgi:flagellar FliJ protein